jgi:hypothetical protein
MAPEKDERVITLNISFLEFAILTNCLTAAEMQFIQKAKYGMELENIEATTYDMIDNLHDIVNAQAKLSTSHLNMKDITEDLKLVTMVNENFSETFSKVLKDNFFEMIRRSKNPE